MKYKPIHRRQARQQSERSGLIVAIIAGGGLLLLAVALFSYLSAEQGSPVALASERAASGSGEPMTAVHEMGAGPAIPFLPAGGPQPDIVITEARYDFGSIGPKDVVERTFTISNEGAAPLTISRAYTTCGCTTAEISSDKLEAGESATVRVIFDPGFHDSAGQTVRRGVILENNDPSQSQAEIWIQATVRSE